MLPSLNALVRVAVGNGADPSADLRAVDVPSRVEGLDAPDHPDGVRRVLVATPRFPGDAEEPPAGAACRLTWTAAAGIVELPVAFEAAVVEGSEPTVLRLWWLTVTGEPVRTQRRDYFRCPLAVPVTVGPAPPAAGTLTGRTTDLSEGGLRCLLVGDPLSAGTEVRTTLARPDGQQLHLPGRVLRSDPARRAPDHADTVVRFADPEATGDDVRRVIFAEQLRLRRLGLD